MASTATISSTFNISIIGDNLNVSKSFKAPRAFKVVGITATNSAATEGTIQVTGSLQAGGSLTGTTAVPPAAGAAPVRAQATAGPTSVIPVIDANANIAAGEIVTVVASAATITSVILHCVATSGGQALPFA